MSASDRITVIGNPTPEQLAAVVVLLRRPAATEKPAEPAGHPCWGDRRAGLRRQLAHGPGGWRAAGRP